MRSILVAFLLSLSLSSAAVAEGFVEFDVSVNRFGKLNSRNMVLEFEPREDQRPASIVVAESSGELAYAETEPGTEYTALDFQRVWPEFFFVGTGGQNWPGGGFAQFGWIDFAYVSRQSLTVEMDGLWCFPLGHPREFEPAWAVMTMVLHQNGDVEMQVEVD